LVEEVAADEPHITEKSAEPGDARVGLPTDQPPDLVALLEQMLGEVGAVLTGDAGDQRTPGQQVLLALRVRPPSDRRPNYRLWLWNVPRWRLCHSAPTGRPHWNLLHRTSF